PTVCGIAAQPRFPRRLGRSLRGTRLGVFPSPGSAKSVELPGHLVVKSPPPKPDSCQASPRDRSFRLPEGFDECWHECCSVAALRYVGFDDDIARKAFRMQRPSNSVLMACALVVAIVGWMATGIGRDTSRGASTADTHADAQP